MITQIYMILLSKSIVKNVLCILNKIVFVIKLLFQIKGIAISDCHLWGLLRSPRWHTLWRTHPPALSNRGLLLCTPRILRRRSFQYAPPETKHFGLHRPYSMGFFIYFARFISNFLLFNWNLLLNPIFFAIWKYLIYALYIWIQPY